MAIPVVVTICDGHANAPHLPPNKRLAKERESREGGWAEAMGGCTRGETQKDSKNNSQGAKAVGVRARRAFPTSADQGLTTGWMLPAVPLCL